MKINGLSRVKMPITQNVEVIEMIRRLYEMHKEIDNLFGDKLSYDTFTFLFSSIQFIEKSTKRDELATIKSKEFTEDAIPRYVILCAMRHAAKILDKMIKKTRSEGRVFYPTDYFQLESMVLEHEDGVIINAFKYNELLSKLLNANPDLQKTIQIYDDELKEFGRFWILERFFPPDDRKLWLEGIELLRNINDLVIDDIRDYILNNEEGKPKEEEKVDLNSSVASRKDFKKLSSNSKMPTIRNAGGAKTHLNSEKNINAREGKRQPSVKNKKNQAKAHMDRSYESDDDSILMGRGNIGTKLDLLRPPKVWNFPIEKYKRPKPNEKVEIRIVDPTEFYKDHRVVRFMDILNQIKVNMIEYSSNKGQIWNYYYDKILPIIGIQNTSREKRKSTGEDLK